MTEIEQKLLRIAAEVANLNHADVVSLLDSAEPDGRMWDWREHVPESLRIIWPSLNEQARLVAFVFAAQVAKESEYD